MTITPIPGFADPFSSMTHLLAAFVFLLFGIRLIMQSRQAGHWLLANSVYVFTVVFLLSMSGVYHLLDHDTSGRMVLQRLDHAGIFALIAGTFTPVHVILFKGFWRWGFLILIWTLAITGITLKSIFFNDLQYGLGLIFYLTMGWMGVFSGYLTHRLHGFAVVKPLLYGAIAYTIGGALEFLQLPILIPGVLGAHEIFHIAVLFGIAWHWQFVRSLMRLKSSD